MPAIEAADLVKEYKGRLKPGRRHTHPVYAAMVERVDATVGQVRAKLKDLGLALNALEQTGTAAELGPLAARIYQRFAEQAAHQDFSAIITDIRDRSEQESA